MILGKIVVLPFHAEASHVLSSDTEFANGSKDVQNAFFYELNHLQTEAFTN